MENRIANCESKNPVLGDVVFLVIMACLFAWFWNPRIQAAAGWWSLLIIVLVFFYLYVRLEWRILDRVNKLEARGQPYF